MLPKTTSKIRGRDGIKQVNRAPTSHRLPVPLALDGGESHQWKTVINPSPSGARSGLMKANETFKNGSSKTVLLTK